MTTITTDTLAALTGLPIISAVRCAMGFENRTYQAALADGQPVIIQMITNRGMATHKIRLARVLPERLAAVGLRAPHVLQVDPSAEPPFIVREFIEGESGAALLANDADAITLARAMGVLLPLLAQVRTHELGLHSGWAHPNRLAAQAHSQLQRRQSLLQPSHVAALRHTIEQVEALFAGRPAVFAHGDFCPVNVIVAPHPTPHSPHPTLIDTEFARIADPLFDASWWGWVVRYHHPDQWRVAFPHLLAAAHITNDDATQIRIAAIQQLRLLEALDYNASLSPERGTAWATRLAATLGWNS